MRTMFMGKLIPTNSSFSCDISIHKSQGSTIDLLEVNLGESIFACGQAYVALSRARNSDSVKIKIFNPLKSSYHRYYRANMFYLYILE